MANAIAINPRRANQARVPEPSPLRPAKFFPYAVAAEDGRVFSVAAGSALDAAAVVREFFQELNTTLLYAARVVTDESGV